MQEIDVEELLNFRQKCPELILLDCRGADYWRWERIPSSFNLRWKYIADQALSLLPHRHTRIITYCDGITCPASTRAYEQLVNLGYSAVYEYSGGLSDWKAHGHSTDCDPQYKIAQSVYTFPHQHFYDSYVNCYLIEEEDCIVLIDGPQQLSEENEDFILNFGKPVEVILTHASTGTSANQLRERLKARIWLHQADRCDEWLVCKPDKWLNGGESFGSHLTVVHTPGHSPGSVTIIDTQNKMIFTGDHLAGTTNGDILDPREDAHARGSMNERLHALVKLLGFDFNMILPFHSQQIRSGAKVTLQKFLDGMKNGKD